MSRFILGLDAGTSVVKAALFTGEGRELGAVARRTTLKNPQPAWAEVSMSETWAMTVSAIGDLLAQQGITGDQISIVGITGNMVGAWLIDEAGQPVRDAILWADGRSQVIIDQMMQQQPDFMSRIFAESGSVMQQGCTLPVLRWLADYEPASLERARHVLCCKDWLIYNLTGMLQMDPTEASVLPGSARLRGFSDAMFELIDVQRYRHLFPPVVPSEQIVGTVQAEAAALTGLAVGTPVIAGAGDVPASCIGVGAVEPGVACSLLGTNFLNCLITPQPVFEPPDVGVLFCIPGGNWIKATINVSGTTSLDWAVEQFCQPEKAAAQSTAELFTQVEALVQQSEAGAGGVIYLPYLSPQGITAPIAEPAARADFFGLTHEHSRADLLRAVYEGLALSIRDGYDVIPTPVHEIRLSGGAAKSAFFCQLVADCTGRRVIVPQGSEFGAKGAALLAAVAAGHFPNVRAAVAAQTDPTQVYTPDPARQAAYAHVHALYTQLRQALLPVWQAARSR